MSGPRNGHRCSRSFVNLSCNSDHKREMPSILMLSPWPSIYSMQGAGTPVGVDLLEAMLDAGYTVDVVAPANAGHDWFPQRDRLRVHRYRSPRITATAYPAQWAAWVERTL